MLFFVESRVIRADDPRRSSLEARGWTVSARSWAAELEAPAVDRSLLRALIARVAGIVTIRSLGDDDVAGVLALDRLTGHDYPGGLATRHQALTVERARVTVGRVAFGAFTADHRVVAMTYLDLEGEKAETDFTVVSSTMRGHGVATAVKAASVDALLDHGIRRFRTGGSSDNAAIIAANQALGYVRDEEWLTLESPG